MVKDKEFYINAVGLVENEVGKGTHVKDACKIVGISKSSFYKYLNIKYNKKGPRTGMKYRKIPQELYDEIDDRVLHGCPKAKACRTFGVPYATYLYYYNRKILKKEKKKKEE